MNAVPEPMEQPHAASAPRRRRFSTFGGAIVGTVLAAALLAGTVPRVARQRRLADAAAAVAVTLPTVSVTTVTHELGEEIVASYLYQIHLYDWLGRNDNGRFLTDNDL